MYEDVHSKSFVEMEDGYPEVLGGKVEDIMSKNPLTVTPHDPVLEAASYMGLKNFRRIPVVDKGRLVGMVSTATSIAGYSSRKGCSAEAGKGKGWESLLEGFVSMRGIAWLSLPLRS